ncbi:MAG: hypothetical protein ACYC9L_06655 [Sulfuricaulis sp.]
MKIFATLAVVAALLGACSSQSTPPPVPNILLRSDGTCDITGIVHPGQTQTATIKGTNCKSTPVGAVADSACGQIECISGMCTVNGLMQGSVSCPIRDFGPGWTISEE